MNRRQSISAYTPSNTDPELLQRIFVQRQRLLGKIVDRLARSMTSGDKHHMLLVGPRGCGKTHLVTLAEYELRNRSELANVMRIAWLGEDDTFTGLIDIALGIADQLAEEYPDEFDVDFRAPARGLPPDDAAESILNSIIQKLEQRSILLIMENMDRTFDSLGDLGQKKWRAFLQEKARIATLATSQQLFAGITSRDEAFFGFFDIHHLKPLSVDDAGDLIEKISREQDQAELISFLKSSEGRFRIRALHHLAGGNHRMYVLLAEFLTKESLDDLVEAFEQLAEELTPYFQERVRSLAPQQAKIVQSLCNASGAMTVKEIAEDTFIAERNCSKQLGNLKQKGYVQSQKRGKESYYEMAEPLMRLCLEVKNQRGRPLKLVAKFLRAWFPEAKLFHGFEDASKTLSRSDQYRVSAKAANLDFEKSISSDLNREIQHRISERRFDEALELADELHHVDPHKAKFVSAKVAFQTQNYADCVETLTAIIDDTNSPAELTSLALLSRGIAHGQQGGIDREIDDYTALIEMDEAPAEQIAMALLTRGVTHGQQGDVDHAIDDYTALIEMDEAPTEQIAKALLTRGLTHGQQGDIDRAIQDYTALIEMDEAPTEPKARALIIRGAEFWRSGNYRDSQEDFAAALRYSDLPSELRTKALFALPEPMVMTATRPEVIASLESAFREGDPESVEYGGTPHDLLSMVLQRGHAEWVEYIAELAPLYIKYRAAEKLGQGVTATIELLDTGDYSDTQLDQWNAAWQEAGNGCDELELPLRSLAAAIEAIKTRSDRPLFRLPLEIREIVRPLLKHSLSA